MRGTRPPWGLSKFEMLVEIAVETSQSGGRTAGYGAVVFLSSETGVSRKGGIDAEQDTFKRESLLGIDCGFNMGNILVSVVCLQFRPLGQGVEIRPGTEYQVGV